MLIESPSLKQKVLQFLERTQEALLSYGPAGLLAIAFLDSAGVPLPGGVDWCLILLCAARPEQTLLYVLLAIAGSMAGCLVLYGLGRKGGQALLERRVGSARAENIRARLRRSEFMAVTLAAIAPPPMPFKPFVIAAGVLQMQLGKFLAALLTGRLVRYGVVGWLAAAYGREAWEYLRSHGAKAGLAALALVIVWFFLQRKKGRTTGA
jgi:membrane protein YqaA with SNARE-associated domain